FEANGNLI
nr:Chain P, Influenza virus epitope, FEANGNLI [synthetic construct]